MGRLVYKGLEPLGGLYLVSSGKDNDPAWGWLGEMSGSVPWRATVYIGLVCSNLIDIDDEGGILETLDSPLMLYATSCGVRIPLQYLRVYKSVAQCRRVLRTCYFRAT